MLIQFGSGFQFQWLKSASEEVSLAETTGEQIESYKYQMADAWKEISVEFEPSQESIAHEIECYKEGYVNNMDHRVSETIMMQTQALGFMMFWRVMGLMLLGMALLKMGVLSALKSTKFYTILAVIGYGIGVPVSVIASNAMIENNFDIIHLFMIGNQLKYVSFILITLGHISVIILIIKLGILKKLTHSLSCVGRMALTNYLLTSIICTTIFYGFGLGLFNRFNRFELIFFIFPIWIFQLLISPWWLKRFRFGPAEWVWRSLTYWQKQPMKL